MKGLKALFNKVNFQVKKLKKKKKDSLKTALEMLTIK